MPPFPEPPFCDLVKEVRTEDQPATPRYAFMSGPRDVARG